MNNYDPKCYLTQSLHFKFTENAYYSIKILRHSNQTMQNISTDLQKIAVSKNRPKDSRNLKKIVKRMLQGPE